MNSINSSVQKKYLQLTKIEKDVCDYLALNLQRNKKLQKKRSSDTFERSNQMFPPSKSLKQIELEKFKIKEFICNETLD